MTLPEKGIEYIPPVLISVHGIRTYAPWQKIFSAVFSGNMTKVLSYDYGRYGLCKFLNPLTNDRMIDKFYSWFGKIVNSTPAIDLSVPRRRPSIAAHSFGSWIVCHAMLKYEDIKFDKIVLCGSILPRDFDWAALLARDQFNVVRNECGLKDPWPSFAGALVARAGTGGSKGFNWFDSSVENVKCNEFGHSEFMMEQHMREHWLPFFYDASMQHSLLNGRKIQDKKVFAELLDFTGTVVDPEAYGKLPHYDEAELPRGLSMEWVKINPDIYIFLMDHLSQRPAGYINAMPVSERMYQEIRGGQAVDNAVSPMDIVPFTKGGELKIYLMSIAIMEEFQHCGQGLFYQSFVKLVTGFVEKLVYYANMHQVVVSHMIAVAWTPAGNKLCEYLQMQRISSDRYGNNIYELDIRKLFAEAKPIPPVLRRLRLTYKQLQLPAQAE